MRSKTLKHLAGVALALAATPCAFSFIFDRGPEGGAVTLNPGSTTLAIRLGTTPVLMDGSNYSTAVLAAMEEWNAVLGRVHLLGNIQPPGGNQQEEDGINEIVFSATVYGLAYNPGVVAVTMGRRSGSPRADGTYRRVQADIFFNTANNWNSYRGLRQQNPLDIRRTALHELGHVIGLLHPNEAGQNVAAVLNNNAAEPTLTPDDIAGGQSLYGLPGSVTRPPNNNFNSAAVFSGTLMTGTNMGATKESGEPNHAGGNFGGTSVWWHWTAPANGSITLTTAGSNFDTVLAVYAGDTLAALNQLAANDDVQNGVVRTSTVTLPVAGGRNYLLAVDGFDADTGNIVLNLSFTASGGTPPEIIGTLPDQIVTSGRSIAFGAPGAGGTLQWQGSTDGGGTWANLANNATYAGVTTRLLEIANASEALNGTRYRYVVTNNGAAATSNAAVLTVAAVFFPLPVALAVDGTGGVYVADAASDTIQRVSGTGQITLIAGTANQVGTADGTGATARFNDPSGLAAAPDNTLLVADTANGTVRRITATGVVTTLAGSTTVRGSTDGPGAQATFSAPTGVARDVAGVLYVADATNHTIRRIAVDGTVTTLAGTAGSSGTTDGVGAAARFNRPTGLAADGAGNVFVADSTNNTIRRITSVGVVTTHAGLPGVSGSSDGSGDGALFNNPTGLAVDAAGNVFVADTGNSTIRRITPAGVTTTVAGLPGIAGLKEGTGSDAWFNQPRAIAVAGTDLIVADTGNAAIRRITAGGVVAAVALAPAVATPAPPLTPPPAPAPTPAPAPRGGGGGGGAPGLGFFVTLGLLLLLRSSGTRRS